ncbi:MBL fold metallo-hydrolase [Paenibacillus mendelii]|uniref:MBL fold metallo-hydrolase n=1 Tax=Paenibacillus mendelii TaxID=206163 RepID=A0ABV6JAQ8_9BACL
MDGGISVHAHAAKHEDFESTAEGHHLFLSYMLRFGDDLDLFHAGDTIAFPELEAWVEPFQPDIAMLPINGRDYVRQTAGISGNMNYREAADFGYRVGARLIVPMHVGLFRHNDENPAYFVDYLSTVYPNQPFHLFASGERSVFP